MGNPVFCTVFTPAYNRRDKLPALLESLKRQTCKDFEWVVVDDGSTDGTDVWFDELGGQDFPIHYQKVVNGGKHRAINHGLDMACGRVFAIVDSDDFLTDDAVEKLAEYFASIDGSEKKFCGVASIKGYADHRHVGSSFQGKVLDAMSTERKKFGIEGDKFEVFYTDVLRANKFPTIENENFMTEAVVWNRLSYQGYYIRWFSDCLYICEYLANGLTDRKDALVRKNPLGYALYIRELAEHNAVTLKDKLGYYSYYYKVCKADRSLHTIALDLHASAAVILTAYWLRLLVEAKRTIGEKHDEGK